MRQRRWKTSIYFLVVLLIVETILIGNPIQINAATTQEIKDEFQVSSGVYYKDIRQKETTKGDKTKHNALRVLEMDLKDPNTLVKIGYPDSLNKLQTTTTQVKRYHSEGHYVVGAINGSFNHLQTNPRFPMSLIAENNKLVFAGEIGGYINKPIAFGINRSGKGIIDSYNLQLSYKINNGVTHQITGINRPRSQDNTILYTSDFYSNYTDTNDKGIEIVVATPSNPNLTFGSTYEGEVVSIRKYGDKTKTAIPENGFVVSAHGTGKDPLQNIQIGDKISVSVNIDDKWKNANFILSSGPMLVDNGKVSLSMNPNSSRAREVAPRSAVAIDKTGEKIFFVTVDGRQEGYSKGMNLTEFAEYLVSIGAYRALNLDGGGSTTMAVRFPGDGQASLANSPSDGRERGVSTILMAVSTEPAKHTVYYKDMKPGDTHYEGVRWIWDKGIQGYPDGTYGAAKQLTRPHAAIMFTNVLGLPLPNVSSKDQVFKDVSGNHLYAQYIKAVKDAKIFNGSNGNFLPDSPLTREQMATTLVNAFDLKSNGEKVNINLKNVNQTHKESVQILADLKITNQLKDFRPTDPVTRGQFATFLYKVAQLKNN